MITSRQNEKIKLIRSLSDKKNRDATGLYLAEGIKTVTEAFKMGATVKTVVFTEKNQSVVSVFAKKGFEELLVSDDVFKSVSGEVTPQGMLAVIEKPKNTLSAPKGRCILSDCVKDPSNIGAIVRSAAAAGYNEIYLVSGSADAYGQKAVRASMSGIFAVKIFYGEREEILKVIDCPIYVADMNGENVFSFKADKKFCLAIGNEGCGISEAVLNRAEKILSIPMENGIESLNASVSAGILMYALKNS